MDSYSAEEIRFNLLAIAQRPLPLLKSRLHELSQLRSEMKFHLDNVVPDWTVFADSVQTAESSVDANLIAKAIKAGDARDLIALKKALDRDINITNRKVSDEEEKISQYMV
jgi:hypothetical protein